MIDSKEICGFNYFLNKVEARSQYGKLALKNLAPLDNEEMILVEQEMLLKTINYENDRKDKVSAILSNMKNISLILKRIKAKQCVEIVDLFEVKVQALQTQEIINTIDNNLLTLNNVDDIISVLDPHNEKKYSFHLYEVYDDKLHDILYRKREIEQAYFRSGDENKQAIIAKRQAIVNEEIVQTEKVILMLVTKLSCFVDQMISNVEILTNLDMLIAKSRVYSNYGYCVVEFGEEISVSEAVLPLVKDYVSNYQSLSIDLLKGSTLITGANMGGKSTILKNLVFQTYLYNYGFLPIAKRFSTKYINNIVYIVSMEDTSHGLSRFGNEISLLNEAIANLNDNTLFVADEFASSTNPHEGYLFMKSLINYCNSQSAFSIFTTHYDNLSNECPTYVVAGIDEKLLDSGLALNELMDYTIKLTTNIEIPRQALLVAKYMNIDSTFLKILDKNYKGSE